MNMATLTKDLGKRDFKTVLRDGWNDFKYAFRDLGTQKAKTFFGIGGIVISIFLMQVVGAVTDSLSFSYLDAAATNTGAADFIVTSNFETLDPFMDQYEAPQLLSDVTEIASIHERLLIPTKADVQDPLPGDPPNKSISLYGLDVQEEHDAGLGWLKYQGNDTRFTQDVPEGFCVITPFVQETLHVDVGDNVTIHYGSFDDLELTIMAIVEPAQKFLVLEVDVIITNLEAMQEFYALDDKVNYFEILIKNKQQIYDARNIPRTINKVRKIGEKIQDKLGSEEYTLNALKLQDLEASETMNVAMSVAFIFISVISSIIAAILINSILSTSVEERIREFGVFRVLGARRSFPFKLIILQGLIMAIVGSGVGVFLGSWFAKVVLPYIYNWLGMWTNPIPLVVQPTTIMTSLLTGIGITLVVTAIPAWKGASTKIVEAINPYRHQKTRWKRKKEGRVHGKLIAAGAAGVSTGALVFYLIPQIVQTGDILVLMIAFLGVQVAFLFGLTFLSLGFIPGLEKVVWGIFRLFNKKTTPIVKTSLHRYRRRNTSTTLMFSMTFAFILFISTSLELMKVQQSFTIEFEYGSEMAVYSTDVTNQVDEDLFRQVQGLPGVSMASAVYTDSLDLRAATLYIMESGTQNINISRGFDSDRHNVYLSDIIGYNWYSSELIGIDENYSKMMDESLMRLKGGKDTVNKLFDNSSNNIIIAKSVAGDGQLSVNDNVRLTFYNSTTGSMVRLVNATIVGISDGMPGFWQFRQARFTAFIGGVLCSKENYIEWMDLDDSPSANRPLSKIFIDTNSTADIDLIRNQIQSDYDGQPKDDGGYYDFIAQYAKYEVDQLLEDLSTVQLLFRTILGFAILIA
ncbi:FtsX-like permease family protein, partial [Candidatus Bathyarchaeota archaeon]|nr:FtsX-like permease family protein [Candidatus Bathyarchaeota archaeon]